jgi:hypothetical protein
MKAFHNSEETRQRYIDRMAEHIRLDQLQPEMTWDERTNIGCAVGCTFNAYDHSRGPEEIGFPVELIRLQDRLFEGLAPNGHQEFALAFLRAPKLGADLTFVWPRLAHWLLSSEESPMYGPAQDTRVKSAIDAVAALYAEWIETQVKPSKGRWEAAWAEARAAEVAAAGARAAAEEAAAAAAWAAAEEAAEAAAWAAAWEAAQAPAWAAEWAARAAWAAASAATWASARAEAYRKMADKLLQLMAEAPVALCLAEEVEAGRSST